jgi:hypothetical protein
MVDILGTRTAMPTGNPKVSDSNPEREAQLTPAEARMKEWILPHPNSVYPSKDNAIVPCINEFLSAWERNQTVLTNPAGIFVDLPIRNFRILSQDKS